jgi:hypothetical protein
VLNISFFLLVVTYLPFCLHIYCLLFFLPRNENWQLIKAGKSETLNVTTKKRIIIHSKELCLSIALRKHNVNFSLFVLLFWFGFLLSTSRQAIRRRRRRKKAKDLKVLA